MILERSGMAPAESLTDAPHMSSSPALQWLGKAHGAAVHGRRVRALANAIAPLLATDRSLLDIGCGDGRLTALLAQRQPSLAVRGLDVLVRPDAVIDVQWFDGRRLPMEDKSVDTVLFVDVLHHANDARLLLQDAARVARRAVVIKDHRLGRPGAHATLRLMDWVGNRAHGVALPYDYWTMDQWRSVWRELRLDVSHFQTGLDLYPWPAHWLFETGLHFLARLTPAQCR